MNKISWIVWLMYGMLLVALLASAGCVSPLRPSEMRKITAWGMWSAPMGMPLGVGYWHSERGPAKYIDSEDSADPPNEPSMPRITKYDD